MNISYDSNADLWKAYTKSNIDRWNQNFVNGEYIIAYEFDPGLHPKLLDMLPKVKILAKIFGSNIITEYLFL